VQKVYEEQTQIYEAQFTWGWKNSATAKKKDTQGKETGK